MLKSDSMNTIVALLQNNYIHVYGHGKQADQLIININIHFPSLGDFFLSLYSVDSSNQTPSKNILDFSRIGSK